MTPNPSIERTAHGKPWAAAHVKRWHYPFRIGAVSMFDGIDRDKILLDLNRLRLKYLTDT
jgi:hypothetical protein